MKKIALIPIMLLTSFLHAQPGSGQPIRFSDYTFITPEGWFVQNHGEYLSMSQSQEPGGGCMVLVIPPQPSSGNLEADVKNVFDMMYPGWNYRNTGDRKYDLVKGITDQGLAYCIMQAEMSKLSADGSRYEGFEDGVAMVIGTGNKAGIISARHNTSMMAHNDCLNKYETWLRFFNSLHVVNAGASNTVEEPAAKRIVGIWNLTGHGVASGEYVFAANGNYQLAGALGSSTSTRDDRYEYLHLTTYAFKGDGTYTIQNNQLNLKKHGTTEPEVIKFRFDKVNYGGSGWNDRIHLLKINSVDGKEYEVCYEKKKNN